MSSGTPTVLAIVAATEDTRHALRLSRRLRAIAFRRRERPRITLVRSTGPVPADPDWLIVLASPAAADSPLVESAVARFRRSRGPDRLLIALVDGGLEWDDVGGDWATATTAIPPAMRALFDNEPRWVDLRPAATQGRTGSAVLDDAAAGLLAPVLGARKVDLVGSELRRHRRVVRTASLVGVAFVVLGVLGAVLEQVARDREQAASARLAILESQRLAAEFLRLRERRPATAILLAVEAWRRADTPQAESAILMASALAAEFPGTVWSTGDRIQSLSVRGDGLAAVLRESGQLDGWEPDQPDPRPTSLRLPRNAGIGFDIDGVLWVASTWEGHVRCGSTRR